MSNESPTANTVITDASCFIILDKIDGLFVLESLFSRVVTTPEIAAEYGKRLPAWVDVRAVGNRDLFTIMLNEWTSERPVLLHLLRKSLSRF